VLGCPCADGGQRVLQGLAEVGQDIVSLVTLAAMVIG
jgi:hypothetical protein